METHGMHLSKLYHNSNDAFGTEHQQEEEKKKKKKKVHTCVVQLSLIIMLAEGEKTKRVPV